MSTKLSTQPNNISRIIMAIMIDYSPESFHPLAMNGGKAESFEWFIEGQTCLRSKGSILYDRKRAWSSINHSILSGLVVGICGKFFRLWELTLPPTPLPLLPPTPSPLPLPPSTLKPRISPINRNLLLLDALTGLTIVCTVNNRSTAAVVHLNTVNIWLCGLITRCRVDYGEIFLLTIASSLDYR